MPTGRLTSAVERTCKGCGSKFVTDAVSRKHCALKCRKAAYIEKYQTRSTTPVALQGNPIGTAAEMLVCFDLERRGLHVYRALNASARHDLIVTLGARLWTIQVKNARMWKPTAKGKIERITFGGNTPNCPSDVIALAITESAKVFYFRPKNGSMYQLDTHIAFWKVEVSH